MKQGDFHRHDVTATLQVKAEADAEPGVFSGYASVFGVVDQGGDRVMPGAFGEKLAEARAEQRLIPMLWQHDRHEPIGAWLEMVEDEKGLKVKGKLLVDDDPVARRAWGHVKAGTIGGMSIGYRVNKAVQDPEQEGVWNLVSLDLREVSLVTMPMLMEARIDAVKSLVEQAGLGPTLPDLVTALTGANFDPALVKAITEVAAPLIDAKRPGPVDHPLPMVEQVLLELARAPVEG